ncbi:hypothetical protein QRB38_13175, partial [Mycobacterium avium subsp. hominissuis]|nr:hypothetical protein [Mycobacterium avium subsp. hominissuis]
MSTPTLDFACAAEEPNPIATTDRARTAADTITAGSVPDLAAYDILLVNISAGKDSQASLDVVAAHARAAGMSRLSCRFCVLASRADLVCSARLNRCLLVSECEFACSIRQPRLAVRRSPSDPPGGGAGLTLRCLLR